MNILKIANGWLAGPVNVPVTLLSYYPNLSALIAAGADNPTAAAAPPVAPPPVPTSADAPSNVVPITSAKKRPGRPPKNPPVDNSGPSQVASTPTNVPSVDVPTDPEPQPAPAAPSPPESAPAAPTSATPPAAGSKTLDDARAALAAVNGKKGLQAAKDLLAKFSADRISALAPANYDAFIAEAAAVTA